MKRRKRVLYIHHYGDQHGNNGVKTIGDGGSNIHIHLIQEIIKQNRVVISTYQDNYVSHNYFDAEPNVKIVEHKTLSGLLQKNVLFFEILQRCLYPSGKYLFTNQKFDYVITQTDFLPDVLAGLFVKINQPKTKWIASYFLEAPKPWDKNSPYKGRRWFIGLFYWLLQRLSFWIIKMNADMVMVTSEPDVQKFITRGRDRSRIVIPQGGVDIQDSESYLRSGKQIPFDKRKYDACFVGRFHYQKGVLGLIDIWKMVSKKNKDAKLAIIGMGPLERDILDKIKELKLEKNIDVLGYMSGKEKYDIFKNSKVMVHPATYDSGGMAAAEGLAWGLPGVAYDLESLQTYYPKGMLKATQNDNLDFANKVLQLLTNRRLYSNTAKDALDLIRSVWDWRIRSKKIWQKIK